MEIVWRWLACWGAKNPSSSLPVRRLTMPLATQVLSCDPASISFPSSTGPPKITHIETLISLTNAAHHLTQHLQPVAFPTETVYGLGALALNATAAARIFAVKNRPADNPLIVHVSSMPMLYTLLPAGYKPSRAYEILMEHFWPGPLTLVFPRDDKVVPALVSANHPTVAVRLPSHPVARALIAIADAPLAAPSANSSGKPSPTRAEHVLHDLHGKLSIILDGGPCGVGLESTVVDGLYDDGDLRVLRPGGVTVEEIEGVLALEMADEDRIPNVLVHRKDYVDAAMEQAPRTPGMKYRHYSPSIPVLLLMTLSPPPDDLVVPTFDTLMFEILSKNTRLRRIGILSTSDSPLSRYLSTNSRIEITHSSLGPSSEPRIAAQRLFDAFLTLESEGMDMLLVEEMKEEQEGLAVMNRVRKAAGEVRWVRFPSESSAG